MRALLCLVCAAKPYHKAPHPEDTAMGFKWRRVEIPSVKKPAVHHVAINGERQPEMETLMCDGCGEAIKDGSPAVAITQWRNGNMGAWEKDYQ